MGHSQNFSLIWVLEAEEMGKDRASCISLYIALFRALRQFFSVSRDYILLLLPEKSK